MKKISLLLALAFIATTMSCGSDITSDMTTTADTTTAPESTAASDDPGLPEKTFDGAEINFLVISEKHNANNYSQEIYAEAENGDALNDAVYKRNSYVEEKYDVKITETRADDPTESARIAIMAQEDLHQVMMMAMEECMSIANIGGLLNLREVEYIDLDKVWWDSSVNDALTYKDKSYLAVGDINIMDNNATWVTFFNKKIAEDYNLPDLYKLADEGKWTMDALLSNARITCADLNGDNEIGWEHDLFGIGTDCYNFSNFLLGAGEKYWDFNESGELESVLMNERAVSVMNKIFEVMYDEPTTVNSDKYWGVVSGTPNSVVLRDSFSEDRMGFYVASLLTYPLMRHMKSDFGLLPMPKFDEAQEQYYSPILPRNTSALSIPVTNTSLEMTGIIVEAMAAKSSTTLTPAYYDITIAAKGLRDEDSARMLDIVLATRVVDFGSIFDFGGIIKGFQELTMTNSTAIASTYDSLIGTAKNEMAKVFETLY